MISFLDESKEGCPQPPVSTSDVLFFNSFYRMSISEENDIYSALKNVIII